MIKMNKKTAIIVSSMVAIAAIIVAIIVITTTNRTAELERLLANQEQQQITATQETTTAETTEAPKEETVQETTQVVTQETTVVSNTNGPTTDERELHKNNVLKMAQIVYDDANKVYGIIERVKNGEITASRDIANAFGNLALEINDNIPELDEWEKSDPVTVDGLTAKILEMEKSMVQSLRSAKNCILTGDKETYALEMQNIANVRASMEEVLTVISNMN